MSELHSIWTVVVFVLFIAIVLWAWSGKNKKSFEDASRLPLDDEGHSVDNGQNARGAE